MAISAVNSLVFTLPSLLVSTSLKISWRCILIKISTKKFTSIDPWKEHIMMNFISGYYESYMQTNIIKWHVTQRPTQGEVSHTHTKVCIWWKVCIQNFYLFKHGIASTILWKIVLYKWVGETITATIQIFDYRSLDMNRCDTLY